LKDVNLQRLLAQLEFERLGTLFSRSSVTLGWHTTTQIP
jgi:hypothetical protein